MNANVKDAMRETVIGSDEERMSFGEVVQKLMAVGVERYHSDFLRAERTFYMPGTQYEVVPTLPLKTTPATAFSAAGVEAAVRAIQRGEIKYREFCERVAAAGCVGYFVSLAGRRAVYYGRTLDTYVERFPDAR